MVKFNPPQWKPLYPEFEERTDNGANCPRCGERATEHKTTQTPEYGGTKFTHVLRCECGQYWQCWSYVNAD